MNLLIKPHITEKSMLAASRGVYTFIVARHANKNQLAELVEKTFKVNVTKVSTSIIKTAQKRTGKRRLRVSHPPLKSARFWLKKGESISLFDIKEDK